MVSQLKPATIVLNAGLWRMFSKEIWAQERADAILAAAADAVAPQGGQARCRGAGQGRVAGRCLPLPLPPPLLPLLAAASKQLSRCLQVIWKTTTWNTHPDFPTLRDHDAVPINAAAKVNATLFDTWCALPLPLPRGGCRSIGA